MKSSIKELLEQILSRRLSRISSVGGGSINETFRIESGDKYFFCKTNSATKFPGLFEKEKSGLLFLQTCNAIRVPQVVWCGEYEDSQVLILEWIEPGLRNESFWKKFGEQLAMLHRSDGPRPTGFGFHENNYMGALPQLNTWTDDWIDFFIHCRLQPQIELAEKSGSLKKSEIDQFHILYKKLGEIFSPESPSALHGDLWSGNYLSSSPAEPVLIDPAVYFGHRSMDLAMTQLFGGFDEEFYESYHYHFPLPPNFTEQADVCNLYPLLIHLNLFGSGYLSSIRSILKKYS